MIRIKLSKLFSDCFSVLIHFLLAGGIIISSTTIFNLERRRLSMTITIISILLYAIYGILKKSQKCSQAAIIFVSLYYCFIILFFSIYTWDVSDIYIINFLIILPFYFLMFNSMTEKELQKAATAFVILVSAIGVMSILLFYGLQFKMIHPTGYYLSKWLFPPQTIGHFHGIQYLSQEGRNTSFFPEAPAYAYLLCTALLCNITVAKYHQKIFNSILVITIFTSASKMGFLAVGAYIVYAVAISPTSSSIMRILKVFLTITTFAIIFALLNEVMLEKLESHSAAVRSSHMLIEVQAFLESPLIGHGLGSYSSGSSNSVTSLLADGGIFLWGLYYFPIIGYFLKEFLLHKKIKFISIIYLGVFALCVFQNFTLSLMVTAYFWYLLLTEKRKKNVTEILQQKYSLNLH